jgi:hypothetical protein
LFCFVRHVSNPCPHLKIKAQACHARIYVEYHHTTVKLHAVFGASPRLNPKKKGVTVQFEEVEEARFFIFLMLTLNNCGIRWNMPFDAELTLNFLRVWCTLYISWSSPSPTSHLSSFSSQNSHHIYIEGGGASDTDTGTLTSSLRFAPLLNQVTRVS